MSENGDIAALNAALAKAQGEFPNIGKERTADAGAYSYKYAGLDAVLAAVRAPLAANGLAVVQLLEGEGLRTELRHAEGGVVSAVFPWPLMPAKPQELGSLVSYLRRYSLLSLLGLATEEDDDGAAVSAPSAAAAPSEQRTMTSPPKMGSRTRGAIFAKLREIGAKFPPPEGVDDWEDAARKVAHSAWGVHSLADLSEAQGRELLKRLQAKEKEMESAVWELDEEHGYAESQAEALEVERHQEQKRGDFEPPQGKRGEGG